MLGTCCWVLALEGNFHFYPDAVAMGSYLLLLPLVIISSPNSEVRLAIKAILESKFERLLALVGLVCSSFVVVNQGTARRDELNPMGDLGQITVRTANLLAARRGGLHTL